MNKCAFLNQLRYCYASAEISAVQTYVKIRFDQELFVDTPKIVFSKTLDSHPVKNVTLASSDLSETVHQLKQQEGKDMIVYGGANFVSNLIAHVLIDELFLLVNPVAIGHGLRIFQERTDFELIASTACSNGIVINQFRQQTEKE